ncbi:MAG: helicase-related protein, partial [Vicinamibacterales bacterium]
VTSAKPRRRPRRAVLRTALGAIVDARSAGGLWTAADASIDLMAYQLEPALAAVSGATRLLLADAVGLGKTIQAGLLLSELRERGWVEHALIVCPAGLRDTWAHELASRFGISATILDQTAVAERVAALPPGANPWAGHGVAIASIDFIKRAEVLAALEAEPLELLIADEAHHLTPGTDRGAAVGRLASRATWCAMLSATPHSGDEAAFAYLQNIGARSDALTIFRRRRVDVGLATTRRCHALAVTPTPEEALLFAALNQYTRAIWRDRGQHDHAVRLIAMTLSRRAASTALAIQRTLSRRLQLLGTTVAEPSQPLLPWDEDDDSDHMEPDVALSAPGLESAIEERACLERLIALARQCSSGSKIFRILRLLDRLREPAVIFTEYRDSLDAVLEALPAARRVAAIHGGVSADLRRSAVDAFNQGAIDVLVATDAAGEGLNLHHRCRLVIDLELPWNPLRLEQRVGRVDRLGQRRTVHAIRLFHRQTIEQRVLEHLELRSRRAQDALERHPVTELTMANAIFGGVAIEAATSPSIATTRVAGVAGEAQRITTQRRAHQAGARQTSGLGWTAPRNRRPNLLIMLTRRSCANDSGTFVCTAVEARLVAVRPISNRRECRQLIERERERLSRAPAGDIDRLSSELDALRAPIVRRILAISVDNTERPEQQSSLFDHRSESAAMVRDDAAQKRQRALSRTLQSIASPSPGRARVDLIAVWPARQQ